MNPSDIVVYEPTINVGGVLMNNGQVIDQVQNDYSSFPPSIGVTYFDSTLSALIKTANILSSQQSSTIYAGSSINGVAQVIQDMFFTSSSSYNASLCLSYGTTVGNIFANSMNVDSNNLITHINSIMSLYISGINQVTNVSFQYIYNHTLTTTSNIGTYGQLNIFFDGDPMTLPNLTNLYRACKYRAILNTLSVIQPNIRYINGQLIPYQLFLTETPPNYIGNRLSSHIYKFYIDKDLVPIIDSSNIEIIPTRYVSGVTRYIIGSNVKLTIGVRRLTTEFYKSDYIISITGNGLTSVTYSASQSDISYLYGNPDNTRYINVNSTLTTSAELLNIIITAYSTTNSTTLTLSPLIYIDSSPTETTLRIPSGTGQFPTIIDSTYDSTQSLLVNEELQLINGFFIYPPSINWSIYTPIGPNYSNISGGSYNGYRWITQKFIINNSICRGSINLTNYSGTMSDMRIYLWSTSWYDCTLTYIPGSNNYGILEYGGSTIGIIDNNLVIPITFGASITATNIYIRVGIKSNNNSKFRSITFVQIA